MSTTTTLRGRFAVLTAAVLAVTGLTCAAPAQAAPDPVPAETVGSGPSRVDDATFTWGVNGYAQKGIFGAWTFKDLDGDVTLLDGQTQTEYSTDPVPATSFPANAAKPKANAVKFTNGVGTIDDTTGAGKLSWSGEYVVNAYPPSFNAPNETYADPELTVAADGSGTLTVDFSIGAGQDLNGNPFDAQEFGRLPLMTFDAGSLSNKTATGYRVTPDYQGVTNGLSGQTTSCTTAGGATGWWGSWPQQFIDALNSHSSGQSVLPHFYSTGCGGMNDNKPALPFDVTFHAKHPKVTVSNTQINAEGSTVITVTGENFHPSLATGTRPPLSGQPAGSYVAFGKFAENWRPSQGAASSTRKTGATGTAVKWAVLPQFIPSPITEAAGGVPLSEDGSFTAQVTVDKAALDATAGAGTEAYRYGIYTYPGSGGVAPAYETYTPLTFVTDEPEPADSTVSVTGPSSVAFNTSPNYAIQVDSDGTATGTVTVTGAGAATEVQLANGTATYALRKPLAAGARTLTFTYSGDDATNPSSVTKAIRVNRGATWTKVVWDRYPTRTKPGLITVTARATNGGPVPQGQVLLQLTKAGKTWKRPLQWLSKTTGSVQMFVPSQSPGTWSYKATYIGSSNHVGSVRTWGFTVK